MNMPELELFLKPNGNEDYTVKYFDVMMKVKDLSIESDGILADLWQMVAGIPASPLGPEGITAEDDKGRLVLTEETKQDPMGFPKTTWKVNRATEGDITINYSFYPRDLTEVKRAHPLFDVCNEMGGCTMCGVTSLLALPTGDYKITQKWDLSEMPSGTKTASIKKENYVGTPLDYTFTIYACGNLKSSEDESGKYHVYWFADKLSEDEEELTYKLPETIKAMCKFFRDETISYDVFFRKDPFDISNGGTAFAGGFIYGYSDAMPASWKNSGNTIAHEIVHNWPSLEGNENWYTEGTAEYYSMVIPYRNGLISLEDFASQFTNKCLNYYNNSYIEKSNADAEKKTWEERDAQKIPYGRGLIYLVDLDMRLRKASEGRMCIDDLVLDLLKQDTHKRSDWEAMIERELGEKEVAFLRDLMNGEIVIQPNEDWFDGAFNFTRSTAGNEKDGIFNDAVVWKISDRKEEYAI